MGHSSFVCVCNATYCDTVVAPTLPPEGEYVLYSSARDGGRFVKTQGSFSVKVEGRGQSVEENLHIFF